MARNDHVFGCVEQARPTPYSCTPWSHNRTHLRYVAYTRMVAHQWGRANPVTMGRVRCAGWKGRHEQEVPINNNSARTCVHHTLPNIASTNRACTGGINLCMRPLSIVRTPYPTSAGPKVVVPQSWPAVANKLHTNACGLPMYGFTRVVRIG